MVKKLTKFWKQLRCIHIWKVVTTGFKPDEPSSIYRKCNKCGLKQYKIKGKFI